MQQVSGRTFLEPRLILRLILAFALGAGIGFAGWVLLYLWSGPPPIFLFAWIPGVVSALLRQKKHPRSRLITITITCLSLAFLVLYFGLIIGGGIATFMLFGALGPLLALTCILLLAWGIGPYRKHRWLLALTCGLIGALGALLATEVIGTRGLLDARFIVISGLALAACGLAAELLRHLYETTQEARQQAAQPATTPPTASHQLSRRAVLLGLAGGSTLVATGAGFSWLTRSYLPHFIPVLTYKGQNASVKTLAWSPDGSRIASGDQENVRVWRASDGSDVLTSDVGNLTFSEIDALAWSPDSQRLLIAGNGQIAEMQETGSAQVLSSRPVQNLGSSGAVASWSRDDSKFAHSDGSTIEIWSPDTGQTILTIKATVLFALAWSPDGNNLASSDGQTVQVWDANTGNLLQTYRGHNGLVQTLAWSPDGTMLASGDDNSLAQVWEPLTGRHITTYRGDSYDVDALAWSPDGRHIASGGIGGAVHGWNPLTGRLDFLYLGHKERVNAIAWSPDGSRIASGGDDQTVQVWQPE